MLPSNEDIVCITQTVMNTMVNLEAIAIDQPSEINNPMYGCIKINGAWRGTVIVQTNEELVRQMGAVMLAMPAEDLEAMDLIDVLSEITNMIGGNIKSQVTGPSVLSIPVVATQDLESKQRVGAHAVNRIPLLCNDQPLNIVLLEADEQFA